MQPHTHTNTRTQTLRDGSKKTPSHRNLRGRVGGRDRRVRGVERGGMGGETETGKSRERVCE